MRTIKVATYNIHKCVGMDRKYSPERIAEVLQEVDADIIALQEVLCHTGLSMRDHQAEFIAQILDMDFRLGENRKINGGKYGNAILSRLPIVRHENHDITVSNYEPRGCLHAEISIDGSGRLHFANVHMGTSYFERRQQVHKLLAEHVLHRPGMYGKRIVAGDFNEWVTGVTTKLFKAAFNCVDPKLHLGTRRSFPGMLPVVHLDHVYFDDEIKLKSAFIHKSRTALIASDHLPIIAEFEL